MERPFSPERVAAIGCDDGRGSVRGGVGMDGIWQHHRVCEGGCDRKSVKTRMSRSLSLISLAADDGVVTAARGCR